MNKNSVSITVNEETAHKIICFYSNTRKDNPNEYVRFFAKDELLDIAVTLYNPKAGKETMKCVFQGENAEHDASLWGTIEAKEETKIESKKPTKTSKITAKLPQIGSDEVGTGDFFGPISVCASYVNEAAAKALKDLGVTDSKKLTDDFILSIGPTLIKNFPYSQLLLDNEKYNEVHEEYNMNAIKAKMHNRCILNLVKKHPNATIYQDQFAEPSLYFSYLKGENEIVKNINFSTKGELKFISVALASCIARYSFLKNMQKLSEHYGVEIPFGASQAVEDFAVKFAKKFGIKELNKIVKQNFVTYKKVLERLEK